MPPALLSSFSALCSPRAKHKNQFMTIPSALPHLSLNLVRWRDASFKGCYQPSGRLVIFRNVGICVGSLWLVERSYDEVTQSYSQVMDFCTAIIITNLRVSPQPFQQWLMKGLKPLKYVLTTITRPELMKPMIFSTLFMLLYSELPAELPSSTERTRRFF